MILRSLKNFSVPRMALGSPRRELLLFSFLHILELVNKSGTLSFYFSSKKYLPDKTESSFYNYLKEGFEKIILLFFEINFDDSKSFLLLIEIRQNLDNLASQIDLDFAPSPFGQSVNFVRMVVLREFDNSLSDFRLFEVFLSQTVG